MFVKDFPGHHGDDGKPASDHYRIGRADFDAVQGVSIQDDIAREEQQTAQ